MIPIDFSFKTALITGASQGIGAEMARTFHRAGAKVLINHPGLPNTTADAELLAAELNAVRIGSAAAVAADVSKSAQVQAMMGQIKAEHDGIDFLINNAAIIRDRTISKMSNDEWDDVMGVLTS